MGISIHSVASALVRLSSGVDVGRGGFIPNVFSGVWCQGSVEAGALSRWNRFVVS